jgi:hypothetical protein
MHWRIWTLDRAVALLYMCVARRDPFYFALDDEHTHFQGATYGN